LTGGSSGIGKSFIELALKLNPQLRVCNLSRRSPAKNNFHERLNHFPCDLSRPSEVDRGAAEVIGFMERAMPGGKILLINNSGFGAFGPFLQLDLARQLEMIDLNVRAVVHLTGRLTPLLRQRGGVIMNIASTVGFQPAAYAATYGATKAFVLNWTVALNEELRGSNLRALAVCPGTTTTEFFDRAGFGLSSRARLAALSMTSDEVALIALRALASGRSQVVPGWINRAYTFLGSRLSKPLAARIAGRVMTRMRLAQGQT
jgi:short-subunit dehydrogenase